MREWAFAWFASSAVVKEILDRDVVIHGWGSDYALNRLEQQFHSFWRVSTSCPATHLERVRVVSNHERGRFRECIHDVLEPHELAPRLIQHVLMLVVLKHQDPRVEVPEEIRANWSTERWIDPTKTLVSCQERWD